MILRAKNILSIALLIALCLIHSGFTAVSKIKELNDDNFSDKTKTQDWSLVIFYRNWCTRSKKMIKEMDKAADFMEEDRTPVLWGKLDCETDGYKTCEKFSVSQVPALFLFKKGNYFKEFLNKPDYIGIVRFVKAETGPGYTVIHNEQEEEVFFSGREAKLIGTFKSDDSNLKKYFLNLVDDWKHQFDFGVYAAPKEENDIVLYRPKHLQNKFEPSDIIYKGSEDISELEKWIIENKHGIVGHRHKYNFNDFKEPMVVVYYEMDYERAPQVTHYWRNRVIKVAKSYPDFTFAVSAMKDFNKEIVNFGYNFMRPSITPLVCAYIKGKRYPMKEDFSVETFAIFMGDLKVGKIVAHMRSEDLPESNNEPVKIAVARNFDELVVESGRDTLIKFYAPWCTWCKRLVPVWEDLAKAMEGEEVDIVKYNAESNEVPTEYEVNGYPTLFWVPKNAKKSPMTYQSGKELEDFIQFIAEHATEELKGYNRQGVPKPKQSAQEEL